MLYEVITLTKRIQELGLADLEAYRHYLQTHTREWATLDTLCRITISRFYRDSMVFRLLAMELLPQLAARLIREGRTVLRVWSAGCASGEEPYTFRLLWDHERNNFV